MAVVMIIHSSILCSHAGCATHIYTQGSELLLLIHFGVFDIQLKGKFADTHRLDRLNYGRLCWRSHVLGLRPDARRGRGICDSFDTKRAICRQHHAVHGCIATIASQSATKPNFTLSHLLQQGERAYLVAVCPDAVRTAQSSAACRRTCARAR